MSDELDLASEREEIARRSAIEAASKPIKPGSPGDCEWCGEWSGRLVRGACPPCRDRFKLG